MSASPPRALASAGAPRRAARRHRLRVALIGSGAAAVALLVGVAVLSPCSSTSHRRRWPRLDARSDELPVGRPPETPASASGDRRHALAAGVTARSSSSPSASRAAIFLEEYAAGRRWWNRADPDQHRQPRGRAVDRLRHPRPGALRPRPARASAAIVLAGGADARLLVLPVVIIATPGGAPHGAAVAPPGLAGAGRDPVADGPRPRPARGAAGHPDRHDPRALAGDRRDRAAADGRRGDASSRFAPTGSSSRYTALPVEIYNYARSPQDGVPDRSPPAAILILLVLLLTMNATAILLRNRYEQTVVERRRHDRRSADRPTSTRRRRVARGASRRRRRATGRRRADADLRASRERRASGTAALAPCATSTIDIPRNQITALIGPSGCGKSTLLRCFNRMNDLIPGARMEGEIRFDGAGPLRPDVDPVALRRRIGMVFQKPNPFPKRIYQNVAFGPRINGIQGRHGRAGRALAPPRRALGRGQGQAPPLGPGTLRRPAAAALHRPDARRRARGDPDGRALLGARPDLDRAGSRT